jgi:hypothetical protein
MTLNGSDQDPKAESPSATTDAAASASARRPYRAPTLRRLGSVRELTLGSNNGKPEGGGTRLPAM